MASLAHPSIVAFVFPYDLQDPFVCYGNSLSHGVCFANISLRLCFWCVTVHMHVLEFHVVKSNCSFMVSGFQVLGERPPLLPEENSLCIFF